MPANDDVITQTKIISPQIHTQNSIYVKHGIAYASYVNTWLYHWTISYASDPYRKHTDTLDIYFVCDSVQYTWIRSERAIIHLYMYVCL